MIDYEKLGLFYLGQELVEEGLEAPLFLYEAKDLTTHSVIVGMTGSGKTGLGVTLLEEALIDGIPVIAIDPKGDLGNLLLTFPELRPEDFQPWIEPTAASIAGKTVEEYAASLAERTRSGLEKSGQAPDRIARFANAGERTIYTPGSNAGISLSLLKSFAAPPKELMEDAELLRERVSASASGLLSLIGITGDAHTSREHVLVANILDHAWRAGKNLSISQLIHEIQKPPLDKVGVFDLETFYPASERVTLAMRLNTLIASPGFAGWLEGEPLDVDKLFYTADGRPKLSILAISHLSESERMFFVTLLLGEILSWVRKQPGTSTLRAILYMDEVAGYFPPVSEPPSKRPMLTLLKQARAYGLGVVLATQNPVDLDYKGLSNTGTWFLGRLQTERDKARVLEGLEGASAVSGARFNRGEIEATLAGLSARKFLVNNVHEDAPITIQTRWALSYLRGPLTREHIATLMAEQKAHRAANQSALPTDPAPAMEAAAPNLPPGVPQFLLKANDSASADSLVWRPAILGQAKLHFTKRGKNGVDTWQDRAFRLPAENEHAATWDHADNLNPENIRKAQPGEPQGKHAAPPALLLNADRYDQWTKSLKDYAYRTQTLSLSYCKLLDVLSNPEETEAQFRVRMAQLAREGRDLEIEKLRGKFASRIKSAEKRVRTAEARVEREAEQATNAKWQSFISLGSGIFGALFGRKTFSSTNVGRAATTMRGFGRAKEQSGDVARAQAEVDDRVTDLDELKAELESEIERITQQFDPQQIDFETVEITPNKTDMQIAPTGVVWCPWHATADGFVTPAWKSENE